MLFQKNNIAVLFALVGAMATGCASTPKLTTTNPERHIEASDQALGNVRSWLAARSLIARSMSVAGDVTFDQNGESNSASFAMKSKRLDANGNRIDSLSIEVLGPFGIKLARFLASPEQYTFYDILHGQRVTGATDAQSLEALTQLQGVSLGMMSDLIYGLPSTETRSEADEHFYSNGSSHYTLVVHEAETNTTSALDLEGVLPNDSVKGDLMVVRYRRWNGTIDPKTVSFPPSLTIHFSEPIVVNGISVPQHIDATAGPNKLTLTYDHIDVNSPSLTVKIKMPSQ